MRTEEQITKDFVELRKEFKNAQSDFEDALNTFEKAVRKMSSTASALTYEAQECEDIQSVRLVNIAQLEEQIRQIERRFNGLKCELT